MTPGIGLALLAMVCFGAGDLVYKRAAAAGIEARHFVMLQAWGFCPSVTLYAIAHHQLVLAPAALWGSLAGLVMFVALYNFSRSLRSGSISTNAPIFRRSPGRSASSTASPFSLRLPRIGVAASSRELRGYVRVEQDGPVEMRVRVPSSRVRTWANGQPLRHRIAGRDVTFGLDATKNAAADWAVTWGGG
jgi:hypothetical protein